METKEYFQPGQISKILDTPKATINSYLKDDEIFEPVKVGNNRYRYYSFDIFDKLKLYMALMKDPYRYHQKEIKKIFLKEDPLNLFKIFTESPEKLFDYLKKKYNMMHF